MAELFDELLHELESRPQALADAEAALHRALQQRSIFFGDSILPTYTLPHLIPTTQLDGWAKESDRLSAAIEEVAQAALLDRSLFDVLKLRPDAQELVRIDPGYRRITQLARPDAVLKNGALCFLEFNCDSPAMMTFADVVGECLLALEPLAKLRARARPDRMTERLLDTLLDCYREFGAPVATPNIAITDWPGQKTRYEHQQIAQYFEGRGYATVVCDPRAFRRPGRLLEVEGRPIHLVYRRALFNELLDKQDEVAPLLSAYRDGTVCMVNSLRSYLASSKTLLAFLCDEWEKTPGAVALPLAHTTCVTSEQAAKLRVGERRHVLKRGESHGGQHVLLPDQTSAADWEQALDEAASIPWIAQDYCPVPKLTVLRYDAGRVRREEKFFNWNPFLFGGTYAGSIARASDTPLINISLGGGLLPTVPYV